LDSNSATYSGSVIVACCFLWM